jgi:hypothetical protein
LNDALNHDGDRYVFQVNEEETLAYWRLLIKNQKPYVRRSLTIGIPLLGFAGLMIPILVALDRGALSFSAVLIAELAFGVGYLGLLIALRLASRHLYLDLLKNSRAAQVQFDCTFHDSGITVKKGTLESRMTWDAISMVQDEGSIIAFWYDPTLGFLIPARVFRDGAARSDFVAWAMKHVEAAARSRTVAAARA